MPKGGDFNYNDISLVFTNVATSVQAKANVPEPGSLALLGLGIVGIARQPPQARPRCVTGQRAAYLARRMRPRVAARPARPIIANARLAGSGTSGGPAVSEPMVILSKAI